MKLLTFLLAGPLAGYGEHARWDRRDTADMVTKSAVIGLLGCCLGLPRGSDELRGLDEALILGVRREQSLGILTDFQTVMGADGVILNAQGKNRGSTIITPKQYLQDSAFQIFLSGSEELLEKCAFAMRHPRWVICLGRRGAIPSRPVVPHLIEAESLEQAVRSWQDPVLQKEKDWNARERWMRCEVETRGCRPDGDGVYTVIRRSDAVLCGNENRYAEREVCAFTVRRAKACT